MLKELNIEDVIYRYTLDISKDGSKCQIKKDKLIVKFNTYTGRYYLEHNNNKYKKYSGHFLGKSNLCELDVLKNNKILLETEDIDYVMRVFENEYLCKIKKLESELNDKYNQLKSIRNLQQDIREEDIDGYFE